MRDVVVVCAFMISACGSVSTTPDASNPDATPDSCVAESDAELCAGLTSACESHTVTDACGASRTIDCGGCSGGQGCVAGTCKTPECSSFTFTRTTLAAFSRTGQHDTLGGATPDGRTILYMPGTTPNACTSLAVMLADETTPGSGQYMPYDITAALNALAIRTNRIEYYTLSADGLTLIGISADLKKIVATTRSATHKTDFAPVDTTAFAAINASLTSGELKAPVLSADGLELFYTILNGGAASGNYSAVRPTIADPFPAGTKLPAPATYSFVTAISEDRLTLFMFDNFTGRVLTRSSTSKPFINPNAPAPPTQIEGWNHKVMRACTQLIAQQSSSGGCLNEDIVLYSR